MTTKINLGLSLTLNVMLGFVILQNNKKPVALADFRDAVADTRVAAEVLPSPAAETVLVEAAPAAAAVEEQIPAPAIRVANDWAAYKQEMAEDRDVLVSNLFRSEKNCNRAMNAAVRRLQAAGKDVLFSCPLPASGGGTFYLIRLVSSVPEIPRLASKGSLGDVDD